MPFTRQARRLKENSNCSSSNISHSQELEQSSLSTDEAVLEMNANEKKIVTPDETFANVAPEKKINNNANIDDVRNVMENNNNNQKTDEMVDITEENNNVENVYVAAMEDIKTGENLDEKNSKWSGGVQINLGADDGEQKDDDIFEDEKMVEKDIENNYENTSLDHEETISVSASDAVDSSEVEWEEVVMENVEEVVISITTPTKKKKLDDIDQFPVPQDGNVQVLIKVVEMKDNEDGSHHSKEFKKKLAELDRLTEEYGSPGKVDIDNWMAEYSNSGHTAVEMRAVYQPPPPPVCTIGLEKVVVETRQGLLGMWTPHNHSWHCPVQQPRDDGDEGTEEPMVKIVDTQELEETVSVEVATSQLDRSSDAEDQVNEEKGDVAADSRTDNSQGTVEEKEAVVKKQLEYEKVSAFAIKASPSTMTTPVSRSEQLLKERFNLPPGVSLTLVTTPDNSAPGPAGTRWDRKVMVMETHIKEEKGAHIMEEMCAENVIDLTEDDHEVDVVKTNIIARHIVVESEEEDLKDENSQKVTMDGKKRASRGRGTGTGRGKRRNAKARSSLLVSMRKSILKKPGILKADSFLSNRLSLPQLRSSSSSPVDAMKTGGRFLQPRYPGLVNSKQAPVRTIMMPQQVPTMALGPSMTGQLKSPRGIASNRGSPVTQSFGQYEHMSPGGMITQGHVSASGALVPFRSYHTPRREGFLSPRSTMLSPRCGVGSPHPRFLSPGFSSPRMGLISPSSGLVRRGQMTPEQTYSGVGKMSPVVLNRIHSPLRMMSPVVLNNSPLGRGPNPTGPDCPRKFQCSRIKEKPYSN